MRRRFIWIASTRPRMVINMTRTKGEREGRGIDYAAPHQAANGDNTMRMPMLINLMGSVQMRMTNVVMAF